MDSFSGYSKEEIDSGFSAALIGEASGRSITLDDVQSDTNLRSLLAAGQTTETGNGTKLPDNPYGITGLDSLSVSNKNLFDAEKAPSYLTGSTNLSGIGPGGFTVTGNLVSAYAEWDMTLNPNTSYRISAASARTSSSGGGITVRDFSMNIIGGSKSALNPSFSFTAPAGGRIRILFYATEGDASGSASFSCIQLEIGSSVTAYEPHRGQTVSLPQTLYSLPDGTRDEFEAISGTGIQRIGKAALNGGESWALYDSGTVARYYTAGNIQTGNNIPLASLSSHFLTAADTNFAAGKLYVRYITTDRIVRFDVCFASGAFADVNAFKAWIAGHPVTVLYQLPLPAGISAAPQSIPAYSPASFLAGGALLTVRYNRDLNLVLQSMAAQIATLQQLS